jgi:uncharacterized SAM-dependent methyltransferase
MTDEDHELWLPEPGAVWNVEQAEALTETNRELLRRVEANIADMEAAETFNRAGRKTLRGVGAGYRQESKRNLPLLESETEAVRQAIAALDVRAPNRDVLRACISSFERLAMFARLVVAMETAAAVADRRANERSG